MLVLIGPKWNAGRRLDDPNDFVRIEVREALQSGVPVIPLLLQDAQRPAEVTLPEDMRALVFRQGLRVRHESFAADMAMVERALQPERHSGGGLVWAGILGGALLAGAAGAFALGVFEPPRSDTPAGAETAPPAPEPEPIGQTAVAPPVAPAPPWAPGRRFRDCPECPEMIVIPGGDFLMGSPEDEPGRRDDEGPQRRVAVPSVAMGVTEVTFDHWAACVTDGFCTSNSDPDDEGYGPGDHPVINVSWDDITEPDGFVAWMNSKVAGADPYRLPTEAEWEYAARAGTTTAYPWGAEASRDQANFSRTGGSDRWRHTAPVASFPANPFWLHDMHGNVWEWVQDCWNASYQGAPTNATSRMVGNCTRAVLRGGSWSGSPVRLRSAYRFGFRRLVRNVHNGFRLAKSRVE